jgi:hypothetical protein
VPERQGLRKGVDSVDTRSGLGPTESLFAACRAVEQEVPCGANRGPEPDGTVKPDWPLPDWASTPIGHRSL